MVGAECPDDAIGQVLGILVAGHIAVLQVVYHLGDAAHVESHARGAARHRLHDGVGQVFLQGGGDKHIDGIVELYYLPGVAHVVDGENVGVEYRPDFFCLTTHHDDAYLSGDVGVLSVDEVDGFDQIVESLAFVGDALATEQQQVLVGWQCELLARLLAVAGAENVGVDGVGDAGDRVSPSEQGGTCQIGNPSAASHKRDGCILVDALLLEKNLSGHVGDGAAVHLGAVVALLAVFRAVVGVVTHAREIPLVVHRDDHGLARMEYLVEVGQGEKSLVHPMQMDDVGLGKLVAPCHVSASVGNIDMEKRLAVEPVGEKDDEPFPHELEGLCPVVSHWHDREVVGLLVAH